jgi:hypothetical protein
LTGIGRISRTLVALMLAVLATACGSEADPPPATDGTASEPPSVTGPVEGEAPTEDDIHGIWRHATQPSRMIRFGPDQAFAVDTHGAIDASPALRGTYELDGGDVTVTVTGIGPCAAGDSWTWQAGLLREGELRLVFTETGTGECGIPVGTEWSFIRLSPRSPAGAELAAAPAGGFSPLPANPEEALEMLDGLWLLEGGGHLLRLRQYGTYAIDDEGLLATDPYDAGQIEVGRTTLTLVSVAGSIRCAEGDRLVLRNVRIDGIGRTLRGIVADDACAHDLGARPTWIRITL